MHQAGITDWNFHVLSKDENGLYKRHIHSANMLQKTDIIHGIEQGIVRGFLWGLGASMILSQIPIHGSILPLSVLISIQLASILLGGWHGSLFGYQSENYKIKPFHEKLEQGYYLIMIDVPKRQVAMVEELMMEEHSDVIFCNQDTTLVMPFDKPEEYSF